jgi:hypothetical protein
MRPVTVLGPTNIGRSAPFFISLMFLASSIAGCRSEDGYADCTPGATYLAGCSDEVGRPCEGDPNIRVCSGDVTPGECDEDVAEELGYDDDSGNDFCPQAQFTCPVSGRVAVHPESDDRDFCLFDLLMVGGPPRPLVPIDCTPGAMLDVGCTATLGTVCTGDPTISVCMDGVSACTRTESFAFNDDGEGRCPRVEFACPPEGSVVIQAAPFTAGAAFTCDYAIETLPAP